MNFRIEYSRPSEPRKGYLLYLVLHFMWICGCVIILTKEQVNGLEPIASAWKADILPLKLYLLLFYLYLVKLLGLQRHHVDMSISTDVGYTVIRHYTKH